MKSLKKKRYSPSKIIIIIKKERPYLNPCLLFNITFVGFTFIPFATILLIFAYAFHMVFIVVTP